MNVTGKKTIIQTEVAQAQRDKQHMFPYIYRFQLGILYVCEMKTRKGPLVWDAFHDLLTLRKLPCS